jgi:hypothetical protein
MTPRSIVGNRTGFMEDNRCGLMMGVAGVREGGISRTIAVGDNTEIALSNFSHVAKRQVTDIRSHDNTPQVGPDNPTTDENIRLGKRFYLQAAIASSMRVWANLSYPHGKLHI